MLQNACLQLSDDDVKNFALIDIDKILQRIGRSLADFDTMPKPNLHKSHIKSNRLIVDELNCDCKLLSVELSGLLNSLTDEQTQIYQQIIEVVNSNNASVFVYGFGGTSKTFLWRLLL